MHLGIGTIHSEHLERFVAPFRPVFPRHRRVHTCTQALLGLVSEVPRKNLERLAAGLPETTLAHRPPCLVACPWAAADLDARRRALLVARGSTDARAGVGCGAATGLRKQGRHAVGGQPPYCGVGGPSAPCQAGVPAHSTARRCQWPLGTRGYVPEKGTARPARWRAVRVPASVPVAPTPALAWGLLDDARASGVAQVAGTADAGDGDLPDFRAGLAGRRAP